MKAFRYLTRPRLSWVDFAFVTAALATLGWPS